MVEKIDWGPFCSFICLDDSNGQLSHNRIAGNVATFVTHRDQDVCFIRERDNIVTHFIFHHQFFFSCMVQNDGSV